jgi:hypothetical protein
MRSGDCPPERAGPGAPSRPAATGLTELAATGATLLIFAFKAGRRMLLPRGMDTEDVVALLGNDWDLEQSQPVPTEDMPPLVRRAEPTVYRLIRRSGAAPPSASQVG